MTFLIYQNPGREILSTTKKMVVGRISCADSNSHLPAFEILLACERVVATPSEVRGRVRVSGFYRPENSVLLNQGFTPTYMSSYYLSGFYPRLPSSYVDV